MNNFGNNNRKQLEEQFRNKFENAQFSPPAHLWEQIDAALDQKPWYKRPLIYWTSGLVAALLLVVMFWFTLFYDTLLTPSNTEIVTTKIEKIDKDNTENSTENNTENSEKTTTSINTDKGSNNTDNSFSKEGIRTIQTPNDTNFAAVETNNPTQKEELVINSTTSNLINSEKNTTKNTKQDDKQTSKTNSDIVVTVPIKEQSTEQNQQTILETTKEVNKVEILALQKIIVPITLPLLNPYFEKVIKVEGTTENIASANTNEVENTKKSSGIAFTFGINHTQGIYKPSFKRDSIYTGLAVIGAYDSNLADTLPQINISGTYQQTGFDVALQFGKNQRWSINTGLAKGKATYSFGSTNDTLFVGQIPNGNEVIRTWNNQVQANYEWVQIPIAIGYQFGDAKAKKITGFAQLGTAIELMRSHSYTSQNSRFVYALGNHSTTTTNVWTQVGVNYHLTNRWVLWGGATYKSSLSSLIQEKGVTFSSQAYGWQVGTRFTIFKSKK